MTNKKRFPATAGFDEQQNFPGSFEADRNSKSETRAGGQGQVRAGVQVIKCSCFVIYGEAEHARTFVPSKPFQARKACQGQVQILGF